MMDEERITMLIKDDQWMMDILKCAKSLIHNSNANGNKIHHIFIRINEQYRII